MKQSILAKLAIVAISATAAFQANAQTYNADAAAAIDAGANFAANTNRLMSSGFIAQTTNAAAPTNTVIWFVVDTLNNGIPTNSYNTLGVLPGFGPGGVLGADDQLLWLDTVDGSRAGTRPGEFRRTIPNLPNEFQTANVYMFLWGFTNSPAAGTFGTNAAGYRTPVGGDTLGVWKIGQAAPPGVGNAVWFIGNTWADQYVLPSVVPEPSTMALGAMGAIGAFVLYRRRRS